MKRLLVLLVCLGMAWLVFWTAALRPKLNAVERGRRLAEKTGCFGCHGPDGIEGVANAGREGRTVPSYRALMMFAKNEQEVREWIRDGKPAREKNETHREGHKGKALDMPAFGKRLTPREIDDLVAFVVAVSGQQVPGDSLALAGRTRAKDLGCTGCHGVEGRYARPNPGSLKGYLPSWDGADFPELVKDRSEFDEWVTRGKTKRFESNPMATYFLRRAALHMPAFERFLQSGDLDALWAYVQWLRSGRPGAVSPWAEGAAADGAGADADTATTVEE